MNSFPPRPDFARIATWLAYWVSLPHPTRSFMLHAHSDKASAEKAADMRWAEGGKLADALGLTDDQAVNPETGQPFKSPLEQARFLKQVHEVYNICSMLLAGIPPIQESAVYWVGNFVRHADKHAQALDSLREAWTPKRS
jgi:hypothetical protein